ncbi:uncharacterized protein DS421_6g189290 [Arachis hypogaea]|nr:uncharacterized protein DS421_6g189290 [Arachis hypogaea]
MASMLPSLTVSFLKLNQNFKSINVFLYSFSSHPNQILQGKMRYGCCFCSLKFWPLLNMEVT